MTAIIDQGDGAAIPLSEDERLDDLMLKGRRIIQNKRECSFSMDAVLLAHFPRYKGSERVLELGTSSGVIPLLMADDVAHVSAIELNTVTANLAKRNVALNGLQKKIDVRPGDWRDYKKYYKAESFDLVLANPPYYPPESGRLNQEYNRALFRHEMAGGLVELTEAASYCLRFGGIFAMVHIAERLEDIFKTLTAKRLAVKRLQAVHNTIEEPAKLILVECQKGGRPGIKIMPPLIARDSAGAYTKEILNIYGMTVKTSEG